MPFAERYPSVELHRDVLFVDDGQVLSAAGSAAALDLCLAVIRTDHGADIMRAVSQRLVFSAYREGGQQQFIPVLGSQAGPSGATIDLSLTMAWACARLHEPLSVADLADHANVSVSTLHRLAPSAFGTTPLQWLQRRRVDEARRLLESTEMSIESIATATGLGTATNTRTYLFRKTGLSPSSYRARFR